MTGSSSLSAGSVLQRAHFEQRHQERQRGFRSLILVGAVGMQAVPATAGFGIVKRKLQIVVAQEPVESRPGFAAPAIVSGHAVSLQTGGHRAGGFNRLLIEASLFSALAIKPLRADRAQSGRWPGSAAFP